MASVFTEMMAGTLPSWTVAEDDAHIAFLEAKPSAYGHVICLPKQEVESLFDMDHDDYHALLQFTKEVAQKLEKVVPCKKVGMSVIGLKTLHAHIHLVPLNEMDDILFKQQVDVDDAYFLELQSAFAKNS